MSALGLLLVSHGIVGVGIATLVVASRLSTLAEAGRAAPDRPHGVEAYLRVINFGETGTPELLARHESLRDRPSGSRRGPVLKASVGPEYPAAE